MPGRLHAIAVLSSTLLVASSCGGDTAPETSGDCNVRVEFRMAVYRPTNEVTQDAPRAEELGPGQLLNCNDKPITELGNVTLFAISGVDIRIAVAVVGDNNNTDLNGIYVDEDLAPGELPDQLVD